MRTAPLCLINCSLSVRRNHDMKRRRRPFFHTRCCLFEKWPLNLLIKSYGLSAHRWEQCATSTQKPQRELSAVFDRLFKRFFFWLLRNESANFPPALVSSVRRLICKSAGTCIELESRQLWIKTLTSVARVVISFMPIIEFLDLNFDSLRKICLMSFILYMLFFKVDAF